MPAKLDTTFHEKVWGSTRLSPWFDDTSVKTGEVWFEPARSILVKFIFTSDRLSVQAHPGGPGGKAEMWNILRADPGATVALGFREHVTKERMREASLTGEIEGLLEWMPVQAGETYYTPAGTVHAIGAGIALCEIQQNSDITYRLYDYGRPRALHIDEGIAVAVGGPHPGRTELPVRCAHFETDGIQLAPGQSFRIESREEALLIVLQGAGVIDNQRFRQGEVWSVDEGAELTATERCSFLYTAPPTGP